MAVVYGPKPTSHARARAYGGRESHLWCAADLKRLACTELSSAAEVMERVNQLLSWTRVGQGESVVQLGLAAMVCVADGGAATHCH